SLAENFVTALALAPDGGLWAGTQDAGLDRFDPATGRFTHHVHDGEKAESLGNDQVSALLLDHEGRLWVGTDKGLDRLDKGTDAFRHYHTGSTQPNGDSILSLYEDPDGRLWVGSDHGVYRYDAKRDTLERYVPATGDAAALAALETAPVNVFCSTRGGELWVGTEHGLAVLGRDGSLRAFHTAKPGDAGALQSDHVRGLLEALSGGMWVIGLHGGLSRYDAHDGRFTTYLHDASDPASLSDDDLRSLYRDRTGLLWIGSYNGGIDIYNPRTRVFGYYSAHPGRKDGLAGNLVWSMYKDRAGELWVGTLKGLTRLDPSRTRYTQYDIEDRPKSAQDDKVINAVLGDDAGTLWVGSDYSVSRYLPARDAFVSYALVGPHENPYETSVNVLFEDREHRLWIGTQDGLVLFDRGHGRVLQRFMPDEKRADSLPNGLVTAICQTRDGDLWIGTAQGLARFDGDHDRFRLYTEGQDPRYSLGSNSILSCHAAPDGRLWVGTDNGFNLLDPQTGTVHSYGVADGLPDASVLGILQDPAGELWLATGKGLSRYSPKDGSFRDYGEADGIQRGSFDGGASFAAADGELFFGGEHGLTSFYPDTLPTATPAPGVAITGLTALGKPQAIAGAEPVRLQYRQNILGFRFTAFDYTQPAANRFRYTLEGFDEGWHNLGGEHAVTYTNLDPGDYTLRVLASSDGRSWSPQEATLSIRVLPPPWRTGWAYLGYGLALLLGAAVALTLFARSISRRQRFLEERNRRRWAEALHQLVQSVTVLEDETAIAGCLLESLKSFIDHDRALFYVERDTRLALIGCRGGDAVEQIYHERWPAIQADLVERLRHSPEPRLLTPEEAATLEPGKGPPRHFLVVPLVSGNGGFRLLFLGRTSRIIQVQGVDIAAAMAKQVSVALDKARLIRDLETLATTDGLTRLYNRRTFLQRAESEFERSRRYQRPLTVMMLDVDHFKAVNDTHGHEVGDRVLRLLADECRRNLRQQDVLGRYGGEEFVAFLPETSASVALDVAERLRKSVEGLSVAAEHGAIHMTMSIGIATMNRAHPDVSALIITADQALYQAKQRGRNQTVVNAS
ncbi:MAG TPA: diguanylate cyclase, partial [Gammaproteobacteria bacterium]|nr:diguanylate cyclase [Gammaproteobacteria bacterium]